MSTQHPIVATVTAIPCGKNHDGTPITARYRYELVREPEPFGKTAGRATSSLSGISEASKRHGLDRTGPLAIVWTDTIQPA